MRIVGSVAESVVVEGPTETFISSARGAVEPAISALGQVGRVPVPSGLLQLYDLWLERPRWLTRGTTLDGRIGPLPEFLALEDDLRITANLIDGIGVADAFARLVQHAAHPSGPTTHLAVTYSPSLGEALRLQFERDRAMVPHMSFGIARDSDSIRLWIRPRAPIGLVGDLTGGAFVLTVLRTLELYAFHLDGPVSIEGPPSILAEQLRGLGGVQETSADGAWGVRFPQSWESQPNPLFDDALWTLANRRLRADPGAAQDALLVGRVRAVLAEALDRSGETPSLKAVAAAVGKSTRGLERGLAKAGVTLRGLIEYKRKMRALLLLADPTCTIEDAAERLGFADRATFSRTFRGWFGSPPGRYRRGER